MTHMYQRVLRAVVGREETGVKKEGPRVGVCMLDFREDQFDHEPCQGLRVSTTALALQR